MTKKISKKTPGLLFKVFKFEETKSVLSFKKDTSRFVLCSLSSLNSNFLALVLFYSEQIKKSKLLALFGKPDPVGIHNSITIFKKFASNLTFSRYPLKLLLKQS